MLKIWSSSDIKKTSIECDFYIPINITFGKCDSTQESIHYWRTGDFRKSLIEIGYGANNKMISTITVVMCDKVTKGQNKYICVDNSLLGCPVVDGNNLLKKTYNDEIGNLLLHLGENNVYIQLNEREVKSKITNENIDFLLDDGDYLIGIRIKDINSHDMKILMKSLNIQL